MNLQTLTFNEFYSAILFNLAQKVVHDDMKAAFFTTIRSLKELDPSFESLYISLHNLSNDSEITEIQRKTFLYMWEDLNEIKSEFELMKSQKFKFDFCEN